MNEQLPRAMDQQELGSRICSNLRGATLLAAARRARNLLCSFSSDSTTVVARRYHSSRSLHPRDTSTTDCSLGKDAVWRSRVYVMKQVSENNLLSDELPTIPGSLYSSKRVAARLNCAKAFATKQFCIPENIASMSTIASP